MEFASIELHPGALEALLLKGEVTCELIAYGIGKYLGATKIVESRTVPYYGSTGDDQGTIEKWVAENKKEEGWFVDPHVRPIDIQLLGGQLHITYHVYKFVKP